MYLYDSAEAGFCPCRLPAAAGVPRSFSLLEWVVIMDAYFARQPILDQNLQLFGYELLFRSNPKAHTSGVMPTVDGDYATASVLEAVNINGIEKITSGSYAFVNFTKRLLLDGIATLYPKEYLAVEILEDIRVDETLLEAVRNLRSAGYLVVLDDYIYRPGDEPLLEMSDIIKVEVDGSSAAYSNLHTIAKKVNLKRCKLLAEKVETQEVFDKAAQMGCTLFQGYFFAKPKTIAKKTVSPLKVNQLRLIQEIMKPDIDFKAISNIIKNDVGLSYKLLRLVNSAYYGVKHEISNINQAVVYLGKAELKKWLTFTSLAEISDNKPSELIIMSMTRAYFCEQVAKLTRKFRDADAYFLAGLFSLLDTITDSTLESCLETVMIPPVAVKALLEQDNPGRYALDLIISLENGNWEQVGRLGLKLNLDESQISDIYVDAIDWARQFAGQS